MTPASMANSSYHPPQDLSMLASFGIVGPLRNSYRQNRQFNRRLVAQGSEACSFHMNQKEEEVEASCIVPGDSSCQ